MNKTINLTGTEVAVSGLKGRNAAIRNDGTSVVYASTKPDISASSDGVLTVPAGQSAVLYDLKDKLYILGTGQVMVVTGDHNENPFKTSTSTGGSSGVDEQARAAVSAHAGNAEIHVTAAEKSAWNAKAELSDIPTALPANGGNADTVNGKTVQISSYRGFSSLGVSGSDEADAVWKAIPPDSVFAVEAQYLTSISWNFPAGTGQYTLMIAKLSNQRLLGMFLFPKTNGSIYFANVDQNGDYTGNWRKICDGGNAATLDNHPASDFALKSELDSLAYRVAALEG